MKINGAHYETIWIDKDDPQTVSVIDQRKLPFNFSVRPLRTVEDVFNAIRDMTVRGAPLIGVTAAMGIYLAVMNARPKSWRTVAEEARQRIDTSRPTAVNLSWATNKVMEALVNVSDKDEAVDISRKIAMEILKQERDNSRKIGEHGVQLILDQYKKENREINILTHCNAGWLATIDYGTATAPIYMAHDLGVPVHVWVDETRPRNQGSRLTAYELGEHGVPHTVIADNAGGHLMQHGKVDMVIVGSDRTTRSGDVANKIGTYLKALAAKDCGIPFYVALPTSSIDQNIFDGLKEIPIEERQEDELAYISGLNEDSEEELSVRIIPVGSPAANPAFDVTPSRYVSAYITEKGIWKNLNN